MKTFYKTLTLGVFLAVLAVVSPTFAQDVCAEIEPNQALYAQYTDNYKGTLEQKKAAVKAGNDYIQKYGACETYAQQVDYLKKAVPKLEKTVNDQVKADETQARYERFNTAVKSGKAADIYASGEDILKYEPEFLDVILVLASVGLDEAASERKNDTFNDKAISYAKSAIQKIEGGKTSEKFGAYQYEYKNKDNALGWMNYTIGYIEYYRQNKKDSGLSYLYKATQLGPEIKNRDFIYVVMGDKYVEKTTALNNEIIEIIKANDNQENFESKSKLALSRGYADRAIDAYVKAYDIAKAAAMKETDATKKTAKQKYVDDLFNTLKGLYKFRYETVEKPMTDAEVAQQLNSYIASASSKTLPSPNTEVKPVDPPSEEEKTTETSTTSTTSTTTTTTPAKTASTNGASVKSEATKTTAKPKKR